MNAVLKENLRIGNGRSFTIKDRNVEIIDRMNHPIYGKMYKVLYYDEWFEENAFEYIEGVNNGRQSISKGLST
jgi:hypothetical protein